MSDVVLVAIIGFVGTLVGSVLGAIGSAKLTAYRIEQLEKKVNLHNQVIERTFKLEKEEAIIQEHLETIDGELLRLEDRRGEIQYGTSR